MREIGLLAYLETHEPGELKRDGPGRYVADSHGSLVISNGKWIWNHGQIGGVSALDYLTKVCGVGFVEAVELLTGERAADARAYHEAAKAQPEPQKYPFHPPRPQRYSNGAVSYLQKRGISPEVINRCMKAGVLYESRYYNPKGAGYERWAKIFNLKQAAQTLNYLQEHGGMDYGELVEKIAAVTARFNSISDRMKELEAALNDNAALQKHIVNYSKTRNTYGGERRGWRRGEHPAAAKQRIRSQPRGVQQRA